VRKGIVVWILAALVFFASGAPVVTGADESASGASEPEPQEALPSLEEVLGRMAATIGALASYEDSGTRTIEVKQGEDESEDIYEWPAMCAGRGRMRVVTDFMSLIADGQKLTVFVPPAGEYRVVRLKEGEALLERMLADSEIRELIDLSEIPALLLVSSDPARRYAAEYSDGKVAGREKVGEADCYVVEARTQAIPIRDVPASPVRIWHRIEDGLIVKSVVDLTAAMNEFLERRKTGPPLGKLTVTFEAGEVKLDGSVPSEMFAFIPPEASKKVERFSFTPRLEQFELSGKVAPDFELPSLDGDMVRLSSLEGKVVLLDFWATWCPPCRVSMPQLQELHERFKDQDAVVLAVNIDEEAGPEKVRAFVKELGLTFTVVLDPKGAVAGQYAVAGIPCQVLVDRDGIVVGRHVGADPRAAERVADEIRKLLEPDLPPAEALEGEEEIEAQEQ